MLPKDRGKLETRKVNHILITLHNFQNQKDVKDDVFHQLWDSSYEHFLYVLKRIKTEVL